MPEYFDKYKTFERVQTNRTIDKPVVMLWNCTAIELAVGFAITIAGVYLIGISVFVTLLFAGFAISLPTLMRWIRENLPTNTFIHIFWLLGFMGNDLPNHIRRPKKFHIGP